MTGHLPVLLPTVIDALSQGSVGTLVDATFGGGGYSRALLERAGLPVIGIDRDPEAVARGRELAKLNPAFQMVEGRFGELDQLLGRPPFVDTPIAGVVFDLGVSSFQLDEPERGFSFRFDGPLDMRMGGDGPTAADLVNTEAEVSLARLFRQLGEEPKARRIAAAIVKRRAEQPFDRTLDLADVVRGVVGQGAGRIDPATRTFQALRMAVNDELGELERGLEAATTKLAPNGRLVVVAFHSLEDRLVKRFLLREAGLADTVSRHQPVVASSIAPRLRLDRRRAVKPTDDEIGANPRARSARLRSATKVGS